MSTAMVSNPVKANDAAPITSWRLVFLLIVIHIPFGILMKQYPIIGQVHGSIILAFGIYKILNGSQKATIATLIAYVAGCEILWRGFGGGLFWESGKIFVGIFSLVALFKWPVITSSSVAMLAYVIALLPAIVLTPLTDMSQLKGAISINLFGPFSLGLAGMFFSGVTVTPVDFRKILFAYILPMISLSALLYNGVSMAGEISFTGASNFATSGGFAPVQVSSSLSGGCLMAYWLSRLTIISFLERMALTLVGLLWLGQVMLTFSRSGLYIFVGAMVVTIPFLLGSKVHGRRILEVIAVYSICGMMMVPFLFKFTDGKLEERLSKTETTGRGDMAEADIAAFLGNPVTGLGLGGAGENRRIVRGEEASSHVEPTRLLSEHGMLGVTAMIILVALPIYRAYNTKNPLVRAYIVSAVTYSFLFMSTCGTRLVALSFIYALGLLNWKPLPSSSPTHRTGVNQGAIAIRGWSRSAGVAKRKH